MSTPTADDPDIKIEYGDTSFPPSTWTELQDYAVSFRVRDAGVLKVPSANIFLHNYRGRFTDNRESLYLKDYGIIRIRADVGNGLDIIHYGRIYGKRDPLTGAYFIGGFGAGFGSGFQIGTGGSRSTVEVICKDIGAQKLLDQTKTYPEGQGYASQNIDCKTAIEHFLANTDSGIDTGISLETDNGLITTTPFPRDPNKDTLMDLLRLVADAINYDGYTYVDSSNQLKLHFRQAGTIETNPSITLQRPFRSIEPNYDLDEIGNVIFVWGGTDQGVPADGDSVFTENQPAGSWSYYFLSGSNLDAFNEFYTTDKKLGSYSVYANAGASTYICLRCNLLTAYGLIDASEVETDASRFSLLKFFFKAIPNARIELEDVSGTRIYMELSDERDASKLGETNGWQNWAVKIGEPFVSIISGIDAARWHYDVGSSLNWSTLKYFNIEPLGAAYGHEILCDGLQFFGGLKIDPIKYPTLNPKIQDLAGGTIPCPKVYHHTDEGITSFEMAQTIGSYVLAVKKNLIRKVTATKGAYTWTKPSQYLSLYHPEHNIGYTEKWRILEQQHDWQTKQKVLRTTYTLIENPVTIDSKTISMDTLSGLLKAIKA